MSDVHADADLDVEDDDDLDEDAAEDGAVGAVIEDLDDDDDDDEDDDDEDDDDDLDDDVDGNRVVGGLSAGVLDYLARSIVDEEDAVDIEVEEGRRSVMLRLHVSPSDMGRVIGRRGRVAQAIRTVVRAAGAREGVDTSVDIVD